MIPIFKDGFYSVKIENYERHFLTLWELIAFISKIDLHSQQN
jgi:hypothetical protein